MLRRRRPEDPLAEVSPSSVSPRFRGAVAAALDARRRYADLVAGMRDGPSRGRLTALHAQVDSAVLAAWDTARRAGDIERTLATLDTTEERLELLDARPGAAVAGAADVAVGTAPPDQVGAEPESVVGDLEALGSALHDLC